MPLPDVMYETSLDHPHRDARLPQPITGVESVPLILGGLIVEEVAHRWLGKPLVYPISLRLLKRFGGTMGKEPANQMAKHLTVRLAPDAESRRWTSLYPSCGDFFSTDGTGPVRSVIDGTYGGIDL